MKRNIVKGTSCLNCGITLHEENFCPDCGQLNNIAKPTIGQLIREALANLFAFDSKFYISLWPLMRYPGALSLAVINGKKTTYLPPIRLFLLVVIATLGLNSLSNRLDRGFNDVSHLRKDAQQPDHLAALANADSLSLQNMIRQDLAGFSDSINLDAIRQMITYVKAHPTSSSDSALAHVQLAPTERNKAFYAYTVKNIAQLEQFAFVPSQPKKNTNDINLTFTNSKRETKVGRMFSYATANPNETVEHALQALNLPPTLLNRFSYSYTLKLTLMSFTEFLAYIKSNLLIILLLFVPIMALVLKLLYIYKSSYYYVDHFIFSMHTQTAFFVIIALAILLRMFFGDGGLAILFAFPVYLFLAIRHFYKQSNVVTLINYLIINTTFFFVSGIFLFLVGLVSFLLI